MYCVEELCTSIPLILMNRGRFGSEMFNRLEGDGLWWELRSSSLIMKMSVVWSGMRGWWDVAM